ncbi:MAG: hypothetical protein OEZ43_20740 [Gammaproteobacteria bacterium]|nr:hypothetical protein [Gammaproteobacteria bacterium]
MPKKTVAAIFLCILHIPVASARDWTRYISVGQSLWGKDDLFYGVHENVEIVTDPLTGLEVPIVKPGQLILPSTSTTKYQSVNIGTIVYFDSLPQISIDFGVASNFWHEKYTPYTQTSTGDYVAKGYTWQEMQIRVSPQLNILGDRFSISAGVARNLYLNHSASDYQFPENGYAYLFNTRGKVYRRFFVELSYTLARYYDTDSNSRFSRTLPYKHKSIKLSILYQSKRKN